MGGIEVFLITAVWTLFALCVAFFIAVFMEEYKWSQRIKIGFANFTKLEKHYSFKVKKPLFVCYGASLLLSVGVIVGLNLFARNNTNQLYALNYIVLLGTAISTLAIIISVTKERKNRDLTPIEILYKQIQNSFSNQEILRVALQQYENLRNELIDENNSIVARIENVTDRHGELNIGGSLSVLEELINGCEERLGGFDNALTKKFDKILHSFLSTGKIDTSNINGFALDSLPDAEDVKRQTIEKRKEIVLAYISSVVANGYFAKAESIVGVYEILDELKISYTVPLIEDTFAFIDAHENGRTPIVKRVFASALFDAQSYTFFVAKEHYFWLLNYPYELPQTSQTKIAIEMVTCDANEYAFTFLMRLKEGAASILQAAVASINTENKTKKFFALYIQIVNGSTRNFANKAKESEDLYVVLVNYARRRNDQNLTNNLYKIKSNKFGGIKTLYQEMMQEKSDIYDYSLQVMFVFLNSAKATALFDRNVVVDLLHEYRYTFSFDELTVLDLLLLAVVLINDNDNTTISQAQALLEKPNNYKGYNVVRAAMLSSKTKEEKAIAIINILKTYYTSILLNIVNRTERDRLFYKRLVEYDGGCAL